VQALKVSLGEPIVYEGGVNMSTMPTNPKRVKVVSDANSVRVASTKDAVAVNKQAIRRLIASLRK
jgi:hypothetical protein